MIQRLEGYLGIDPAATAPEDTSETRPPTHRQRLVEPEEDELDALSAPFEPFKDLCKRRFLWYYESYLAAIKKGKAEVRDGTPFKRMPFEAPGSNTMDGKFNWSQLELRINKIKTKLGVETKEWLEEGRLAASKGTTVAVNLQHQFDHIVASFKRSDMPHDVRLVDDNPFEWAITYFGRPMTNLDGGMLRIKMLFSIRFPTEQPRVTFVTKLFHHHVAPDGTVCYRPKMTKSEDVSSHIDAIFKILEEDDPAYDPREIVYPEATRLYWGNSPADKKTFNRKLRRSVQDSME